MTKTNENINLLEIAKKIYQPLSIRNVVKIVKFLWVAKKYKSEIGDFNARLAALNIPVTTEMLGTIEWPYIHNEWDVATKLNTIALHYEVLSAVNVKLTQINVSPCLQICDLSHLSPGVTAGIDYAKWFTREGELVLNIFREDLRVASMAFTLGQHKGKVVAYVGAVQGIHGGVPAEESLEIYKILTKNFAGLRPRSLLLEVLKVTVAKLGAEKIFGVSEQNRHHRHPYFGNDQASIFKNNYNPFWDEHNGTLNKKIGFYEISLAPAIKDLSEIAAKKRGQYRRRYEFIESLKEIVTLN